MKAEALLVKWVDEEIKEISRVQWRILTLSGVPETFII